MVDNFSIGFRGEQLAVDYLLEHGFAIVARNWRAGRGEGEHGEIDIIATKGSILHFVEVKSRSNSFLEGDFSPLGAFTAAKCRTLTRTADKYISMNHYCGDVVIDLCVVNLGEHTHRVRFFGDVAAVC